MFGCLYCQLLTYFTAWSQLSIANFENGIPGWVIDSKDRHLLINLVHSNHFIATLNRNYALECYPFKFLPLFPFLRENVKLFSSDVML